MRDAQGELHKVAAEFDRAIVRSKLGIEELKMAGEKTGTQLQKEVESARELLEEMKLIQASSSRIADRLQEGVVSKRVKNKGELKSTASITPTDDDRFDSSGLRPRTDAEKELLQMLAKSK